MTLNTDKWSERPRRPHSRMNKTTDGAYEFRRATTESAPRLPLTSSIEQWHKLNRVYFETPLLVSIPLRRRPPRGLTASFQKCQYFEPETPNSWLLAPDSLVSKLQFSFHGRGLVESGLLEGKPFELLEGEIIEMSPEGIPHSYTNDSVVK